MFSLMNNGPLYATYVVHFLSYCSLMVITAYIKNTFLFFRRHWYTRRITPTTLSTSRTMFRSGKVEEPGCYGIYPFRQISSAVKFTGKKHKGCGKDVFGWRPCEYIFVLTTCFCAMNKPAFFYLLEFILPFWVKK